MTKLEKQSIFMVVLGIAIIVFAGYFLSARATELIDCMDRTGGDTWGCLNS